MSHRPMLLILTATVSTQRVVGGDLTLAGEFPFSVLISAPGLPRVWSCSGVLISRRQVLTAAHCRTMVSTLQHCSTGQLMMCRLRARQ